MTSHLKLALAFILSSSALLSPAMAATAPGDATAEQIAADRKAMERGKELYAHDQAAWHGSDALRAIVDLTKHPEVQGYLTVPEADGTIALVFYAQAPENTDTAPYEFARFVVDGSEVVSGGLIESAEPKPLSDTMLQMVDARLAALNFAIRQQIPLCGSAPPNIVILPATEDGIIPVYILSAPDRPGRYPLGGHHLIEIGPDNTPVNGRSFASDCLDGPIMPAARDAGPEFFNVTHMLGDQPTEIHYFAHLNMDVPLIIVAQNSIWNIDLTTSPVE